ncbi:MAG: bifunctional [glutamate--ammonia ligase]-adenylyl-L-tyrosine phosphorylase/[glutamate--ammonia-ligase] adenylyltransferase, partial [Desulfosarcinaceae bacterium]
MSTPQPFDQTAETIWQKISDAMDQAGTAPSLPEAMASDLKHAFAFSNFAARQCQRHPDLLADLLHSGDLRQSYREGSCARRIRRLFPSPPQSPEGDASRHPAGAEARREELHHVLRLFRRREMVRIALRDLCGWADLDQTLRDLSMLADACIDAALVHLHGLMTLAWGDPADQQGRAQQLVVLALGKLGACELNFSSDVDLLFAYACEGQTLGGAKGRLSNEDFFQRLCRDLIKAIGTHTAEGFVFRVDTRLRPFGEVGPLAMSFDRLEDYYHAQGREWERYALIKARVVAGDQAAGRDLLKRLKPFVYRRYLDYGTFDGLRDMKERIAIEVRSKGLEENIKIGSGGIREIEFFGQMFQLIRGGVDPALQIRPIRRVLAALVRKRYIPADVGSSLDEAYVFLRTVENRLQQWDDQQVHSLPGRPDERLRLATSLGFENWEALAGSLEEHRRRVHTHFSELLSPKKPDTAPSDGDARHVLEGLWQGVADESAARAALARLGYGDPDKVMQLVASLRQDSTFKTLSSTGHERLNHLIPLVLEAVAEAENASLVLDRIFDLIKSIQRRTSYLALLLEHPAALTHLVRLSEASPWIALFLSQHPVLLDELLDPRTLYSPPRREEIQRELGQKL